MRITGCALALLCISTPALAGRGNFGGLQSADVVGDANVELDSRLADQNDVGPLHERSTAWWIAPTIGLTDNVELQLPVEMAWRSETGFKSDFTLSSFGADARYRFSRAVPALFRFGLSRDVEIRNLGRAELGVVVSYELGAVQVLADAGITFEANRGGVHFAARPGVGVSVRVRPDVRVGAEVFGVRSFDSAVESWAVAGPNLAFTHGRFWFAGSFGIGVHNISTAGRLVWGIGF
jgi:hypothetical protein